MGSVVPLKSLRPASPSLIALWRCIIAVAHADGILHEKEAAHFEKIFANMACAHALTAEQKATFDADLKTPQDIDALLPGITDLEMRCLLVNFAHGVAHVDGELHPKEKALIDKLDAGVPQSVEALEIRVDIQRSIVRQLAQHAGETMGEADVRSCAMTCVLDALLERLGIEIPA